MASPSGVSEAQVAIQASSALDGNAETAKQGPRASASAPKTSSTARAGAVWACQMIASVAWMVSVFIYDSWQTGDQFQMLAASAWTASNLLALPDVFDNQ